MASIKAPAPVEQRRRPRVRTFRNATIVLDDGAMVGCVLRNRHERGACIEVAPGTRVTDRLRLLLSPEDRQHACRVVWRRGSRLGVEYLDLA